MNIVAVTGCFDVIKITHIKLIKFAREYGRVIIGINSDRAVKLLKGENRPINNQNDRKEFLESVKGVYKVFIIDDVNMIEFLKLHKPQYFCRGSDYSLETINQQERQVVESYGGQIIFGPFIPEKSTTNILKHYHD
jgi:rfaE bifunctional protein nucleotidyltransferase chain/domain